MTVSLGASSHFYIHAHPQHLIKGFTILPLHTFMTLLKQNVKQVWWQTCWECIHVRGLIQTKHSILETKHWITWSFWWRQRKIRHVLSPHIQRLQSCPLILRRQHNVPFLTKDCESVTHRDVACLFRTPEHKYPLALWDISSAAPPGLAEKRWRGFLVIIRANPNLVRPPVQSRGGWPVKSHKQDA